MSLMLNGIKLKKMKCSICHKEFNGYPNNAQPINNGQCCSDCNINIVVVNTKNPSDNSQRKTMKKLGYKEMLLSGYKLIKL